MVKIRHILYVVLIGLLILSSASSFYAYNFLEFDRSHQTPVVDDIEGIISLDKVNSIDAQAGDMRLLTAQNPLGVSQTVRIELLEENKWSFADGSTTKEVFLSSGNQSSFYVNVDETQARNDEILYYNITAYSQGHELTKQESIRVINPPLDIGGTVTSTGASGKFAFDLENQGHFNVTITGISVDSTSHPDAVRVGDGFILEADGTQVVTQDIIIGGSVRNFNPQILFQPGQVISFEFDRFMDSGGTPAPPPRGVDMRGESITVTFTFAQDGDQSVILSDN